MRSFASALALAALVVACKSEADRAAPPKSSAPPPPPPTALEPPVAPPQPEPRPGEVALGEKLQPLVDAVATDALVSEDFRLLLDGLDWSDVEEPLVKRLGAATKTDVGCAWVKVHAAKAALSSEKHDPRLDAPLASLDGALSRELAARKVDTATLRPCPDAG